MASSFASKLKHFREHTLQLSQAQFAALVGMGVATINRLEQPDSRPPSPAHEFLLESLREPANLLRAIEGKEKLIGAGNVRRLQRVAEALAAQSELAKVAQFQRTGATKDTTGRKTFELNKLIEMIRFFTAEGEWKTKLNKLLFYPDFIAYQQNGESISGTRYVKGDFGPIPDKQEPLYSSLVQVRILEPREDFVSSTGQPVEKLFATQPSDRSIFTRRELNILERVRQFFRTMTAKQVADYSHEETLYVEHTMGQPIPYSQAKTLRSIPTSEAAHDTEPVSFSKLVSDISATVPPEEWSKLPKDGAKNVDHYLYGAPKRRR